MFKKEKDPLELLDSEKKSDNSSLLIFHIDSPLRRICLRLTEEPELTQVIFERRDKTEY